MAFVRRGAGTAANGNNSAGPLAPGLPAGTAPGDLLVVEFQNQGAGAAARVPSMGGTGWTEYVWANGNARHLVAWKIAGESEPTPSITLTGTGVLNDTQVSRCHGFYSDAPGATIELAVEGANSTNASADNIGPVSGITIPSGVVLALLCVGKANDVAGTLTLSGWTLSVQTESTTGNDASTGLLYQLAASAGATGDLTVTDSGATASNGVGFGKLLAFVELVAAPDTLTVEVRQGAALIATRSIEPGAAWADVDLSLSSGEVAAITDPADLRVVLLKSGAVGGLQVSEVALALTGTEDEGGGPGTQTVVASAAMLTWPATALARAVGAVSRAASAGSVSAAAPAPARTAGALARASSVASMTAAVLPTARTLGAASRGAAPAVVALSAWPVAGVPGAMGRGLSSATVTAAAWPGAASAAALVAATTVGVITVEGIEAARTAGALVRALSAAASVLSARPVVRVAGARTMIASVAVAQATPWAVDTSGASVLVVSPALVAMVGPAALRTAGAVSRALGAASVVLSARPAHRVLGATVVPSSVAVLLAAAFSSDVSGATQAPASAAAVSLATRGASTSAGVVARLVGVVVVNVAARATFRAAGLVGRTVGPAVVTVGVGGGAATAGAVLRALSAGTIEVEAPGVGRVVGPVVVIPGAATVAMLGPGVLRAPLGVVRLGSVAVVTVAPWAMELGSARSGWLRGALVVALAHDPRTTLWESPALNPGVMHGPALNPRTVVVVGRPTLRLIVPQ